MNKWNIKNSVNKNTERLIKSKKYIKENKELLVFHSVAFKSTTWHNILLWWKSGSWKSFIFQKLKELWIVAELYDQDLVKFKDWYIYSLTNESFKWFENWKHIYKNNINNKYWKLDYVFFVDNNFCWIKEANFDNNNIIKYMLHEEHKDILEIYKEYKLWIELWIKSYIIGNNKTNGNFIFLQELLSKNK